MKAAIRWGLVSYMRVARGVDCRFGGWWCGKEAVSRERLERKREWKDCGSVERIVMGESDARTRCCYCCCLSSPSDAAVRTTTPRRGADVVTRLSQGQRQRPGAVGEQR